MQAAQAWLAHHNLSPATAGMAAGIAGSTLLGMAAPAALRALALVPGRFIPCVWSLVTAGLVETNIFKAAINVVALLACGSVLEPLWGTPEWLRFLVVVDVAASAGTLLVLLVAYAADVSAHGAGKLLYVEVCGAHALVAGCLVAIKQVMPDTEATLFGTLRFRLKHAPALFVLGACVLAAVTRMVVATVPFVVFGAVGAWTYLRFAQVRPGSDVTGDASAEFRLASFFPDALAPAVDAAVERAAALARARSVPDGTSHLAGIALSDAISEAAARRRERGTRALEERLGLKKGGAAGAAPADVEAVAAG